MAEKMVVIVPVVMTEMLVVMIVMMVGEKVETLVVMVDSCGSNDGGGRWKQ